VVDTDYSVCDATSVFHSTAAGRRIRKGGRQVAALRRRDDAGTLLLGLETGGTTPPPPPVHFRFIELRLLTEFYAHQDRERGGCPECGGKVKPIPSRMPIAAVTQMEGAVVRPRTVSSSLKITPAPEKADSGLFGSHRVEQQSSIGSGTP
jgi:hypothetical protein